MQLYIVMLHVLLWIGPGIVPTTCHSTNSLLLVISLDGFRKDSLDMMKQKQIPTPNFDKFIAEGGQAEYMTTIYPSKTFPAHYSIATGLHAENHGLVQNKFWDPLYQEPFDFHDRNQKAQSKWFDNNGTVEPLWISNQRGAQTIFPRRSGVIFWPGGTVEYGRGKSRMYPQYYIADGTVMNDTEKLQKVVSWFATEDAAINFAMVHLGGTDHIGHRHGPESDEVIKKITEIDSQLGILFEALETHHLFEKLNIILLSDHGMAEIKEHLYLDEYVDRGSYKAFGFSPMWQIIPQEGKEEEVKGSLQKLANSNPKVTLYLDQKTPEEYHFSTHRRILAIILTVSEGVLLAHNSSEASKIKGDHGYPDSEAMRAFLAVRGPAFERGVRCGPVEQVDMYPLMCHVLDMPPPRPHNGSLIVVRKLLVNGGASHSDHQAYLTLITFVSSVGFAAAVSGVCCVTACRVYRISRVRRSRMHHRCADLALTNRDSKRALLTSDDEEI